MLGKAFIMLATMSGGDGQPVKAPEVKPVAVAKAPVKVATATPTPVAAAATTPDVIDANYVVGKLQQYYQNIQQYEATFEQVVVNSTFGNKSTAAGVVRIKKPGKMRWDYQKPTKSSYISDGSRLWSVDHKKKQVLKMDLRRYVMSVAVTFLYGKGDLRRDFTATLQKDSKLAKKDEHVVTLVPKLNDARYKTLTLVVDPSNFRVKRSVIVTTQGETNSITFYSPVTNKPLKDGWFTFNEKAHKDYRIIQPGKKGSQ